MNQPIPTAEQQKATLLAKGHTEESLKENSWRPKPWMPDDDRIHQEKMDFAPHYQRCPGEGCTSVGTFKARYNPAYGANARYYVCKWCGYSRTRDGEWQFYPDPVSGWGWKNERSGPTPKMLCEKLDPWR
jgi:hypothetical protein